MSWIPYLPYGAQVSSPWQTPRDLMCGLCAGPLFDPVSERFRFLENCWSDDADTAYTPVPVLSNSTELSTEISEADGKFWADWVSVNPGFPNHVSGKCKYHGNMITVDGVDHSRRHAGASEWLFVHRGCLSLVCHRLRLSPRQLWSSLFAPRNRVYCKDATGLIRCIEYYDMAGSARKFSADAFERITLGTVPCTELLDCMWLLARPTVLPIAPPVVVPQRFISHVPAVSTACLRVLTTPELLDIILDKLVHHHAEEEYASLLMADPAYVVLPCLVEATATLFSLIQVSRYFHSSILARRQDLFLRIAWESGWMLPASPGDWDLWPNGALAHPSDARRLCGQPGRDWRKYLLAFLRREDLHVRNRWRLHRMHVQFARGKVKMGQAWERPWKWSVGSLGVRTSLVPPERMPWEYAC